MFERVITPLIFPAYLTRVPRPEVRVPGLERHWLDTPVGEVEWWHLPPDHAGPRPAVFFAHGNAELIDDWAVPFSRYASLGVHLVLVEYRGYGRSAGRPTEDGLAEDLLAVRRIVEARPDVDETRIVYHGRSIGGGVVCAAARRLAPAAMVLQSTFTGVHQMARRMGAPRLLAPRLFDNLGTLRDLHVPVHIFHGEQDTLIPPSHARRLADAAPNATLRMFDHADHNTPLYPEPRFWSDIQNLLDR